MSPVDPRLVRFGRTTRRFLAAAVGLGLASAALVVAQAALLAHAVASAFLRGATLAALRPTILWLLAVILARAAVAFAAEVAAHGSAARVKSDLRLALVRRALELGPGFLEGERTGELAAAAVQGVEALDAYYARYLPQLVLAVVAPVAILAWIFPHDRLSALILLATLPLVPIFMALIGRLAEDRTRARWATLAAMAAHFLDVLQGLPTLRIFGRGRAQAGAIREITGRFRDETMATLRISFLSALVLELIATIGTAVVAVAIGLRLLDGRVAFEAGLAVLVLTPEVYLPLRRAGVQFHASTEGVAAASRIFAVLDAPAAGVGGALAVPDLSRATIRFEDVALERHERIGEGLAGVSFELRSGERVALVGPSGAGKSTVAALLLRFVSPTAGRITVGAGDGAAPVDLAEIDPAKWRRHIAWVPQRPHLFPGTIADNIRLGEPDASDEAVREAARLAGALGFVDRLPRGFDTRVGEGGARLSAGQRSRIAIARALVRPAPLLVLDEPTANLDPERQEAVREALAALPRTRTVLLIAHRPAMAALADRVVALDGGRVVGGAGGLDEAAAPAAEEVPA